MTTVQNILDILEEIAPAALACAWDNVGLLVGSPQGRVSSVLLAVDPSTALIAEAEACTADVVITHHPGIFHPLKALRTDQPGGAFLAAALRAGISVISCHTNLDAAQGGVNDALAQELGLCNTTPLCAHEKDMQCGMGRIGELPTPLAPNALVQQVRAFCPWLLEAGPRPRTVARVALCGGSGSDLAEMALTAGADVFLTAEIRHHTARWAEEAGLWLLDGGHFATEYGAMRRLCQQLAEQMQRAGLDVPIRLARQESPLHLTG